MLHFRATLLMGRVALCVVTDTEVEKSRIMSACHFTLWGAVCVFVVCVKEREVFCMSNALCARAKEPERQHEIFIGTIDGGRSDAHHTHKTRHATGPKACVCGFSVILYIRTRCVENYLWFEFLISCLSRLWNFYIMTRPHYQPTIDPYLVILICYLPTSYSNMKTNYVCLKFFDNNFW
jgi:hypothetical protein